ncbi:hypothetical protein [Pontibacter kalidii]|uniref:hypothetical protein n=1 Tax=Pontibacter kalidii TaxID=2592049 RepID=UPI00225800E1|nr:hypothetical protein [Pontibacter kalidii]
MQKAAAMKVWLKSEQSMKGTSGRLRQGSIKVWPKYKRTTCCVSGEQQQMGVGALFQVPDTDIRKTSS